MTQSQQTSTCLKRVWSWWPWWSRCHLSLCYYIHNSRKHTNALILITWLHVLLPYITMHLIHIMYMVLFLKISFSNKPLSSEHWCSYMKLEETCFITEVSDPLGCAPLCKQLPPLEEKMSLCPTLHHTFIIHREHYNQPSSSHHSMWSWSYPEGVLHSSMISISSCIKINMRAGSLCRL